MRKPAIKNNCKDCGKEIKNIQDAAGLFKFYKQDKKGVKREVFTKPICKDCFYNPNR